MYDTPLYIDLGVNSGVNARASLFPTKLVLTVITSIMQVSM
jgi:hypothetical protein